MPNIQGIGTKVCRILSEPRLSMNPGNHDMIVPVFNPSRMLGEPQHNILRRSKATWCLLQYEEYYHRLMRGLSSSISVGFEFNLSYNNLVADLDFVSLSLEIR